MHVFDFACAGTLGGTVRVSVVLPTHHHLWRGDCFKRTAVALDLPRILQDTSMAVHLVESGADRGRQTRVALAAPRDGTAVACASRRQGCGRRASLASRASLRRPMLQGPPSTRVRGIRRRRVRVGWRLGRARRLGQCAHPSCIAVVPIERHRVRHVLQVVCGDGRCLVRTKPRR